MFLFIYLVCVLVNILITALATVEDYRQNICGDSVRCDFTNSTVNLTKLEIMHLTTLHYKWIDYFYYATIIFFTLDVGVRFTICPNRQEFCADTFNRIDFACLASSWTSASFLILVRTGNIPLGQAVYKSPVYYMMYFLACIEIARVVRVFRLAECFMPLRVILLTLQACWKEFLLLNLLLFIGTSLFAQLAYLVEASSDTGQLRNIPIAYWWAAVTMTTLGYGDIYPTTCLGYLIGIACVMVGLVFTGLPIAIITKKFER